MERSHVVVINCRRFGVGKHLTRHRGVDDHLRTSEPPKLVDANVKFSELVRLLETEGFALVKQKGSVRYYGKTGWPTLIRVDYHGLKEVPKGTCHAILKAAGIQRN